MKKILKDKIINIEWTDKFDKKFLFEYIDSDYKSDGIEVFFMSDLLEKRKNSEILKMVNQKPAMYSNVYSPEDEIEIFKELSRYAITKNKKIHIIWITLKEEIEILEEYYEKLWFLREDINCFAPDFSKPLITVSVNLENLMWKWSDYKAMREKIFFNPPIRESGQVRAMFKGINRGVTAWIYMWDKDNYLEYEKFLSKCVREEKILAITLAKILRFNLEEVWFVGKNKELIVDY